MKNVDLMEVRNWFDFLNRLSLKRSVWSYVKVQRLVGSLLRNRLVQLRYMNTTAEYLNVGCGNTPTPEFCNLDYIWLPGVICWDITKGLPFRTGSLRGIFTEHCLEHLPYDQCIRVLREFKRTLRAGAVARVIVPDGERYCRLYVQAIDGAKTNWPYPESKKVPMHYVNDIMRGHGHRFIYDYQTLRAVMLEAGFAEVHQVTFRQGKEPRLLVDQEYRASESLYVEGIA
jgi:predicted SAM-dependent methyltransferase